MLYYRDKLVRFTGVPLTNSGVWRLTKTNSGLKQTNVPQGWARISAETAKTVSFVLPLLHLIFHENYAKI